MGIIIHYSFITTSDSFTWSHYNLYTTFITFGADPDEGMDPKHFFFFNIEIGCLLTYFLHF